MDFKLISNVQGQTIVRQGSKWTTITRRLMLVILIDYILFCKYKTNNPTNTTTIGIDNIYIFKTSIKFIL